MESEQIKFYYEKYRFRSVNNSRLTFARFQVNPGCNGVLAGATLPSFRRLHLRSSPDLRCSHSYFMNSAPEAVKCQAINLVKY